MNFFGNQQPTKVLPKPKENCKIKIKNTSQGKTIEFEGNCSREQIQMAKANLGDDEEIENE